MTFSLYAATVPAYLQTLRASLGWLDKAGAFAADSGQDETAMMGAKLVDDMFPFNRQVRAIAMHSQGSLEGAFAGKFGPDMTPAPDSFAGLSARLGEAVSYCEALRPDAVDALVGQPMVFELGTTRMDFAAEDFLLSFSLPNFYFHTTTAYAILRHQGMAIGKRDYLGQVRLAAS